MDHCAVVHLHNTAGSRSRPASGKPLILAVPSHIESARLALTGAPLTVVKKPGGSTIAVPPVAMHEVIVLK